MNTNAKTDANANAKQTTLKTLTDLKASLYPNATRAIATNPAMAEAIHKRTAADAAHIAFAINMVQVKC